VPYGIWTGNGVDGITIANLTIRDLYFHPIIFNGGTQRPHVYNVHLINAGQQFIKSNPDASGAGANNGIVEYSVIEYETTARDDYPKGIDVHGAANWVIRHNLFRNIVAPFGGIAGPAVLVWRGSSNTVTEGNTIINCSRGIMYGAEDVKPWSHRGGIIRNNFIFRARAERGDVAIHVADSPDTQVVNNTAFLSGTYRTPIEYRYGGSTNILVANNLLDGVIWARNGATGRELNNLTGATASMFADAANGDLHLAPGASLAVDRGLPLPNVTDDWNGVARPQGRGYDIGADERPAIAAPGPPGARGSGG
jgi:hypothetical protein